jgi:cyanophycinase-like exopeptidase
MKALMDIAATDNQHRPGTIALMGSGELTASMVEVHKGLLRGLGERPVAAFLDTPAGFQLNADQIGATAVDYFRNRVGYPLHVASFKSNESISETNRHAAYAQLRQADYLLLGPGSPTYTVEQLRPTAIPAIITDLVKRGGCLAAASAAAITMGRYTLPVYEIYKVGQKPHWIEGLDILGEFGLDLIVVPHWNNAEGGTHDTSRCFMGRSRFDNLVDGLSKPRAVLGLDEHTACLIDLDRECFSVRGVGTVNLVTGGETAVFNPGTSYPLGLLRGERATALPVAPANTEVVEPREREDFWTVFHRLERNFHDSFSDAEMEPAAAALLEIDRLLWQGQEQGVDAQSIAQARDLFRELLVSLAMRPVLTQAVRAELVKPLVEEMLAIRQRCRNDGDYAMADSLRDILSDAGIVVEDTVGETTWRFTEPAELS